MQSLQIQMLPKNAHKDMEIMKHLTNLINRVYQLAEEGLYKDGALRTTIQDIQEITEKGELAVAQYNGKIVGSIRIGQSEDNIGELGMLSVNDADQEQGIGRALITFAEQKCRDNNSDTIQLELLVPSEGEHPVKKILEKWYLRLGYQPIYTDTVASLYPQLKERLAVACNFIIFQKKLSKKPLKT